jgi:hypothetical protein
MKDNAFFQLLRYLALIGNILFILWMTYNGIDEGFSGTIYQKLSYIGLTGLLIVESVLIFVKR